MHRYQHIAYGNQNKTLQAASALRRRCDGQDDMTLAKLIEICKESGLPVSPLAVTRLELNCQLFTRIGECINEYRDVQQLHLDRNRISRIENLTALQHLRCLYLQGNAIRTIEGLDGLSQLQLLNLSGNSITRLSGLDRLPRLEALLVSDNRLSDGPSIQHLAGCSAVCELDLANNQLGDAEAVLQVLAAMPSLQTLTLAHNPMASAQTTAALQSPPATHVTSSATEVTATSNMTEGRIDTAARGPAPAPPLAFYRRTVVARCPHLTALDHRAVFPQERRYAEAWWQENQQRLREQQYQELGGSADHADQRSMVAGTAASLPPDGANLPTDVVYPVFTRLDARTLAVAALSCRSWAAVAAFPLSRQRLSRAQAALCDAAVAVPRLAAAIVSVQRDELDELLLTSGP
ncbi:hypothetical protein Vretifemale_10539 [Volvox reticuliferus]|nr:hypothetical protein Vretifemale_10539 [Volvox reticuliferus]